ncbi:MAG: c-type cytochrome [Planctomycetes bacterium]|nr:c-type cytochrome [Planctomycetota bacterium]
MFDSTGEVCDSAIRLRRAGRGKGNDYITHRPPCIGVIAVLLICFGYTTPTFADQAVSSPIALAADTVSHSLYIADHTASRILHLDTQTGDIRNTIPLPHRPTGLAYDAPTRSLYVTTDNAVLKLNIPTNTITQRFPAGHSPTAPVLSPNGSTLYFANRFDHNIVAIDLMTAKTRATIPVTHEPAAVAITPNGRHLIVANHKPLDAANGSNVAAVISIIDTHTHTLAKPIRLPDGSTLVNGVCVTPDGQLAFVTHILARNRVPATQLANGWLVTNALSVIDLKTLSLLDTFILDDIGRGAANPWSMAITDDSRYLAVTLAGVHELTLIDLPELRKRIQRPPSKTNRSDHTPHPYQQFNRLRGIKHRIALPGKGPRSIASIGSRFAIALYFSGSIATVTPGESAIPTTRLHLDTPPAVTQARRGERLFHDATLCFQGWQSCATCHPDGRSDGLNWDLTNDGIGNPKNAKSLLFAHRTTPLTMSGIFESLEQCVPFEIRTILFTTPTQIESDAIVAYIRSLRPIPSPYLIDGRLTKSALRGQAVFEDAGCLKCHSGDDLTDRKMKTVGTRSVGDHRRDFDIPSLREVWRTPPYLHDGRAKTIRQVITRFNPSDHHGKTANLTQRQINDLVNYVLSQ